MDEPFPLPTRLPCRRCESLIDSLEIYCPACQAKNAEEFQQLEARGQIKPIDRRESR